MNKNYMDIGHGDPRAVLWLCDKKKIQAFEAGEDTHASIWGAHAMNAWRGRYDQKAHEISVTAPVLYKSDLVPEWLLDLLEDKFGTGLNIWKFNPVGKRVKR